MMRMTSPGLTRTRRRALAVPFVITFVATGAACGTEGAGVPLGDRPETTETISNPAEPEPEPAVETISNPAEPEPEPDVEVISNPAEPEPAEPEPERDVEDDLLVISNPAFPEDG